MSDWAAEHCLSSACSATVSLAVHLSAADFDRAVPAARAESGADGQCSYFGRHHGVKCSLLKHIKLAGFVKEARWV